MNWEIVSFVGMGPIKFGMTPDEVEKILGKSIATDDDEDDAGYIKEVREINIPIITYEGGRVSQIEAFSDVLNVFFDNIDIFLEDGLGVLKKLELLNKSALSNVGILLFDNLGISTGRLDSKVRLERSVTVFPRGYWDDSIHRFKTISFK
jgi:hypothetical protein